MDNSEILKQLQEVFVRFLAAKGGGGGGKGGSSGGSSGGTSGGTSGSSRGIGAGSSGSANNSGSSRMGIFIVAAIFCVVVIIFILACCKPWQYCCKSKNDVSEEPKDKNSAFSESNA